MRGSQAMEKVNIDTAYLLKIVTKSGLSQREFGLSIGKSDSYVYKLCSQGYTYKNIAELICKLHKAEYSKLVKQEEDKKPATDTSIESLAARIDKLESLINGITAKLATQPVQAAASAEVDININEKAILLLKRMMFSGACEVADYKSKAKSYNIPEESVEYALKYAKNTLRYTVSTRGYGNNAKEWIMK